MNNKIKSIVELTILLLFISVNGCDKKDKQTNNPNPALFKNQLEALDKAYQVQGVLQNSADQQRKTIDNNSINNQN